jgi:hypothetical protein
MYFARERPDYQPNWFLNELSLFLVNDGSELVVVIVSDESENGRFHMLG